MNPRSAFYLSLLAFSVSLTIARPARAEEGQFLDEVERLQKQVTELVKAGDETGVQALVAEQRRRWKEEKAPRALNLLMTAGANIYAAQRDQHHFWISRAIAWEVILAPFFEEVDNHSVVDAKQAAFRQATGSIFLWMSPVSEADTEGIRRDTASLIVCYVNQLRASYIPRRKLLPLLPLDSTVDMGGTKAARYKSDPAYRAKILREEAESDSNTRKNTLTLRLEEALGALEIKGAEPAFDYFVDAYSRPPAADAELAWLLDFLKYQPAAREKLLKKIEQMRAFLREEALRR